MDDLLHLKWNNHHSAFVDLLTVAKKKQLYTDVTLACDGKFYSAHRLVLSTCSDYFAEMLDKTMSYKNLLIVLKDIKCAEFEALLDYMYLGEVNVRQCNLGLLVKAAECLKIRGLAVPDDLEFANKSSEATLQVDDPVPSKRQKLNESDKETSQNKIEFEKRSTDFPIEGKSSESSKPQGKSVSKLSAKENVVIFQEDGYIEDTKNFIEIKKESCDPLDYEESSTYDSGDYDVSQDASYFEGFPTDSLPVPDNIEGASFSAMPSDSQWQSQQEYLDFQASQDAASTSSKLRPLSRYIFCPICNKKLSNLRSKGTQKLKYHMLTHTGERKFNCPYCDYKASLQFNLKSHVIRKHRDMFHNAKQLNF